LWIRKHIIALVMVVAPAAAMAQYYYVKRQSEASVYVYGGWSAINYSVSNANSRGMLGGGAGVGYTYYFNNYWALVTGFEVGTYGASMEADVLNSGKYEKYSDGIRPPEMILKGEFSRYRETQNAIYGHIPIMMQLLIPIEGKRHEYYAAAGIKTGMALSSTFQNTYNKLRIWAWLPFSAQTIEDVPQLGFVTRENIAGMYDVSGKLPLKINLMGALEAGIRWKFEDGAALYTGVYLDYGILSVHKQSDNAIVASTAQTNIFEFHSVLDATYQQQEAYKSLTEVPPVVSEQYTNRVHLAGIGIKVRLSFNASGIPIITRTVRCGCPRDFYR
jgi:hypothetical protein